ncbi:efflux RND transporter permease subunit [Pseudomonas sp. S75]|uniref:efflux RND transporter permease subunit n=1 Tax=unclassified Pseudomonas TaxID=196821 RepID=UPI001907F974|nr:MULTISPECIES: efflux RND transporter permease subunit [unclassified Pseudomonas]MBJ9977095.1 efflux RND transporter permease subunit [Pseudomonas sp. S30]MBK0154097.1 efflux RND transporter permease subunit [Pseudomonas sp. S75]
MHFTDLFLRRPILALVVNAFLVLAGLLALSNLPVRQYPLLDSATVSVTTEYPGASAELMQGFVTQPIAQAVASVEGADYVSSSTVQGLSTVQVRLKLGTDSTRALADVIAKVSQVKYKLPEKAYDPVIEQSAGDSTAVAYVGFSTTTLSLAQLTDYLAREVIPSLSGVTGVAKVQTFGGQQLAMRLWLDPARLAARNITAAQVAEAIRSQNFQTAPGNLKDALTVTNIQVDTDLESIEQFQDMTLRSAGDELIKVRDIGTVELAAAARETSALMDGKPAVHLGLFAAPAGNPLTIVEGIKQALPAIEKTLPPGVEAQIAFETAKFIQASIDEVSHTLIEASLIVAVVIFLCLGSLRTVLIPLVTIPLSLLGATALMLAFGFSINLLTLLAMVLAIGLVVDDAIVIVENVHRHVNEGTAPWQAALIGAREIAVPVVTMTLTLAAVYSPIAFIGGLTGALFKEFALSLAGAVIISGVVALTLSPVLAAKLIKPHTDSRAARFSETLFAKALQGYEPVLVRVQKHRALVAGSSVLILLAIPFLYLHAQHELAPSEDQASILTAIKAPQYANLDYTERYAAELDDAFKQIPEVTSRWIINGTDGPANSFAGVNLSAWDQRSRDAAGIQADLQQRVGEIQGTSIFAFQLPPLPGSTGGLPIQMILRASEDFASLYEAMDGLKRKARDSGLFSTIDSDIQFDSPGVDLHVDRDRANALGVSMKDIGDSLETYLAENYTNRFQLQGRSYDVIAQSTPMARSKIEHLGQQYVRSRSGELVPLSALLSAEPATRPNALKQFNQQNAITFQGVPAAGVSLGACVAFLQREAQGLPDGYSLDWAGESRQYVQEGSSLAMAFVMAIVVIYLLLAAQFESVLDPLIILVTVPLSLLGALLPLALGLATVNIYTQIGLVTLIGLISKHGILMIEFANELQAREHLSRIAAIETAAKIRLRPIIMTTAAMVFGSLPLLLASGAGANSRHSLGMVMVWGMLVGTLFTLFVLPAIYALLPERRQATDRPGEPVTR